MLSFLRDIFEFVITTVILKMIVAHWIADQIQKYAQKFFGKSERRAAIWVHYHARAFGKGHTSDSVVDCGEGECGLFKMEAAPLRVAHSQSTSL